MAERGGASGLKTLNTDEVASLANHFLFQLGFSEPALQKSPRPSVTFDSSIPQTVYQWEGQGDRSLGNQMHRGA